VLFIVIDVFNNLEDFLKHGVNMRIVLTYYLYSAPLIFVQIVPVAALVAILFALGNLNRHHEIIAMKACGVSGFHILAPYLFMGVLLSFGLLLVNEDIVPRATLTSRAIMEGLIEKGRKKLDERSLSNVTLYGADGRMVYAREYEIVKKTLYDVVLLEDSPRRPACKSAPQRPSRCTRKSGRQSAVNTPNAAPDSALAAQPSTPCTRPVGTSLPSRMR
jgi:lipopolysaccharide export LptBFGC system permease protein LptF